MSTSGTLNTTNEYLLPKQLRDLVRHLKAFKKITNIEAISIYRIMALPRRIADLREHGYKVTTEFRRNPITGQRFIEYRLAHSDDRTTP